MFPNVPLKILGYENDVLPSSSVCKWGTPRARRSSWGMGGWMRLGTSAMVSWPQMANSWEREGEGGEGRGEGEGGKMKWEREGRGREGEGEREGAKNGRRKG